MYDEMNPLGFQGRRESNSQEALDLSIFGTFTTTIGCPTTYRNAEMVIVGRDATIEIRCFMDFGVPLRF
jgi:hypothetical protein